jgi:hypothetical protein
MAVLSSVWKEGAHHLFDHPFGQCNHSFGHPEGAHHLANVTIHLAVQRGVYFVHTNRIFSVR